jgi:hypothetical protein
MKREFLTSITPNKAIEIIEPFPVLLGRETVDIKEALGRKPAEDTLRYITQEMQH